MLLKSDLDVQQTSLKSHFLMLTLDFRKTTKCDPICTYNGIYELGHALLLYLSTASMFCGQIFEHLGRI
jgi:hypothetical protein